MRTVQSSPILKLALLADAVVSGSIAAAQLLFAAPMAGLLGLPKPLLLESGLFLVFYVALLLLMASRGRLWSALVGVVVVGNIGWALACIALALSGAVAPTGWGLAYLALHAFGVLGFAALEWIGLRRSADAAEFRAQTPATR
ncbi:hypothetical protein PEC18_06650 [Paucibacter sp. O1-1]|uniref:hypothetical protein n=1 Tax=Paucibacter sp. XJ19-41 TaxID=2927824 RepID=UPI0010F8EF8E|nr:hypothetical protein [Paucibacter sp. XJ19-41]MCU7370563.1 hypothetical protein [Paucibacter sp. O1-1]MDA3825550.1 hypothetical protein [Paucibacter sp. O1-1]MDC6168630.1 hypothetical protein [Paucibacter sp. XJ19-41]